MRDDGIPAGWFDTRRRGTRRWWDGTRWTSHITVHGRRTTLAEDSAAVRRQLLVSELVLAAVLVGAILIALWGSLPVLVVRPVIVATGAALVVLAVPDHPGSCVGPRFRRDEQGCPPSAESRGRRSAQAEVVGWGTGRCLDIERITRQQPSEGTTVDLYEYQARDVFEKYGVPVLAGIVADTPEEVRAAAEKIGGVVVVKAQVKTGGRERRAASRSPRRPTRRMMAAKAILGLDIKGHVVKRVMVAQGARIAEEFYSPCCSTAPTAPT